MHVPIDRESAAEQGFGWQPSQSGVRIPMKPAGDSDVTPATIPT
jgi:hypothetical protein